MQLNYNATSVVVRVTAVIVPPPLLLTPALSGSNVLLTWTSIPNATLSAPVQSGSGTLQLD